MKNAGLETVEEAMHRMLDGEVFYSENWQHRYVPTDSPRRKIGSFVREWVGRMDENAPRGINVATNPGDICDVDEWALQEWSDNLPLWCYVLGGDRVANIVKVERGLYIDSTGAQYRDATPVESIIDGKVVPDDDKGGLAEW